MTSRASVVGMLTVAWALACGGGTVVEPMPAVFPVVEPPPPEPEPVVVRPARKVSDVVVVDPDVMPIPEPPPIPSLQAIPLSPPEPRPFITPVGTATITTPPANADAAKVVARFAGQLRACYEVELVNNPNLAGTVVIAFTVEGGRVTDSSINSADTKPSAAFESCLLGRAKRWSFPLEVDGEQTVGVSFASQGT